MKVFTFKIVDRDRSTVVMGKKNMPIDQTSDLIDVVLHAIRTNKKPQIWIEPMFPKWYMAMQIFLLVSIFCSRIVLIVKATCPAPIILFLSRPEHLCLRL